jgi:two-component system, sensor histidine kinase and response regulator
MSNERRKKNSPPAGRSQRRARQTQHNARPSKVTVSPGTVEAMPVPVLISRMEDGVILMANAPACALLGERQMAIVTQTMQGCDAGITPPRGEDETSRRERQVACADGTVRWLCCVTRPVVFRGIQAAMTVLTDVSDRKKTEAELIQARNDAIRANKLKGDFLAKMSHEIRTPLNGIMGMTQLALETNLTEEQREYLELAKNSSDALLNLINDILDLSRIEAGRLTLDPVDFNIHSLVGETVRAFAFRAHEKGVELIYTITADVPRGLNGDPFRIRQILNNLIGNAIKFTEHGEIQVGIGVGKGENGDDPLPDDQVQLHITVRDTGIGIPPENHEEIFQPFHQADSSLTQKYGGSGLGLSITSQLVTLMGGRITVNSAPGKGAEFHCSIRLRAQPDLSSAVAQRSIRLENVRVLLVEDNESTRAVLQDMLLNWRMKVTAVSNGDAALREMRRASDAGDPYPLVILDASMPDIDGFTVAEQIEVQSELAGGFVMLLSSTHYTEIIRHARIAGIIAVVMKPVGQSTLLDSILTVLGASARDLEFSSPIMVENPLQSPRRLSVLLVEDNMVNQRLAVRILEKRGHSVNVAGNGMEGVMAFQKQTFDVILMDIQMPVMNGFEATALIRKLEEKSGKRIPIIAMTAHAMKGDRERCIAAGMDYYVTKPIRQVDLIEVVEGFARYPSGIESGPARQRPEGKVSTIALSRLGGDLELYRQLAEIFMQTCPSFVERIGDAIHRSDFRELQIAAHTLKGAAGTLGVDDVVDAAEELETMGARGDVTEAKRVYELLKILVSRMEEVLMRPLKREEAQ